MQAVPPAETLPAVAMAAMIGAVDTNIELNGSDCCTCSLTVT